MTDHIDLHKLKRLLNHFVNLSNHSINLLISNKTDKLLALGHNFPVLPNGNSIQKYNH